MITLVDAIVSGPPTFVSAHRVGEAWEDFDRAARSHLDAHPRDMIVARPSWAPPERATRYMVVNGRITEHAVRVEVNFSLWGVMG